MKIVGHLKKASKGWALTQNSLTGHYYVGYTGYAIEGSAEYIQSRVEEAKKGLAELKAKHGPTIPAEIPYPHGINFRSYHDKTISAEDKKRYDDYLQNNATRNVWERYEREAATIVHEKHPIFEDILVFKGYTRGRSSVTLEFYASNGQTIAFGPAGIDALVSSIINGTCTLVDATGRQIDPKHQPNGAGGWDKIDQFHTGNGIKARFVFEKKGQNIYANTVFKE